MEDDALVFKALSDVNRLRLMSMLAVNGETCVCVLARALEEPAYKVSRHLRVLRNCRLVQAERHGTWMHYSIAHRDDGPLPHLWDYLARRLPDDGRFSEVIRRLQNTDCGTSGDRRR